MILCPLLILISISIVFDFAEAIVVDRLNNLISEYSDTEIALLILSPDITLEPLPPYPVTIWNRVILTKSEYRHGQTRFAVFIIFPEEMLSSLDALNQNELQFYNSAKPRTAPVYINALVQKESNLFSETSLFFRGTIRQRVIVYQLTRNQNVLTVSSVRAVMKIPSLLYGQPFIHQLVYVPISNCLRREASPGTLGSCRKEIELKLNTLAHGGKFYIDPVDFEGDVPAMYLNRNLTGLGLHRVKDVVSKAFNNPFKKYGQNNDESFQILALEAFDGWIYGEQNMKEFLDPPQNSHSITMNLALLLKFNRDHIKDSITGDTNAVVEYLLVPTGDEFMNFITCDGVSPRISFRFYVAPYDVISELAFLSMSFLWLPLAILFLFNLVSPKKFKWTTQLSLVFDIVYFNIALAFEIGLDIPKILKKFPTAYRWGRTVLGLWSLLTVILVNAYKGLVTTELTSHRPVSHAFFNISEMEGFTFYVDSPFYAKFEPLLEKMGIATSYLGMRGVDVSNLKACLCNLDIVEVIPKICVEEDYCQFFNIPCPANDTCDDIKSKLNALGMETERLRSSYPSFCTYFKGSPEIQFLLENYRSSGELDFEVVKKTSHGGGTRWTCGRISAINQHEFNKYSPLPFKKAFIEQLKHENSNRTWSIFNATSNCDKTAYIDYGDELDAFGIMAESSSKDRIRYRKGRANILYAWRGIELYVLSYEAIILYERYLLLMAHGIFHVWHKWHKIHHPTDSEIIIQRFSRRLQPPEPLTMNSNVITIFYSGILLHFLSLIIICIEVGFSFNYVQFYFEVLKALQLVRIRFRNIFKNVYLRFAK